MTKEKIQILEKVARGSWQRGIVNDFIRDGETPSPFRFLAGEAKRWELKYRESFFNLIRRIEKSGINIEVTPGPRGGEYLATYKIIN